MLHIRDLRLLQGRECKFYVKIELIFVLFLLPLVQTISIVCYSIYSTPLQAVGWAGAFRRTPHLMKSLKIDIPIKKSMKKK